MATQITASCPICGPLDLTPRDVRLIAHGDLRPHACLFTCPRCGDQRRLELHHDTVLQLLRVNCPLTRLRPEIPAQREPLTLDDLIDLGHDLEAL
jgi:hypothetical protein